MPVISGKFDPAVGVLAQVAIFKDSPAAGTQTPQVRLYQALYDTGVSRRTCISKKVAVEVGLQPIGKVPMVTAGGTVAQNTYQFHVGFLLGQKQESPGVISANVATRPVSGAEFDNAGAVFEVLLGRDIICGGSFSLSFDGHYVFSF